MFVLTVVLCLAGASAVPANQQRIVGGSVTTIEQYPTIVALLYSWSGIAFFNQACGGTILNRRSLITAAHCPHGDSASKWRIRVGSTWANRGGTVFGVQSVITHPNYNTQTLDSDIAIMCISGSMTTSSFVQPASIAGPEHIVPDNQVVWAAGWGTVSYGGLPSEQLQHVQIWTVNQAICAERYAAVGAKLTANMLCSGWLDVGGRDQCQGNSGGPLYLNNVVVGVCSWGWGCANHFFPGVNTRVSRFNTWIMANACTEN